MNGKKHYALLGKLLEKNRPDIAAQLITAHYTAESDYSKMRSYLQQFCQLKKSDPRDASQVAINYRREFLCAMLHIYNPHVFNQPTDGIVLRIGFVRQVSKVIIQNEGNTSRMIREVITLEKVYDDFRDQVHTTLLFLKEKGGANVRS